MKKILKNVSFIVLFVTLCFFSSVVGNHAEAATVTQVTAAQTCTWNKIGNICASTGPFDPYPTSFTTGSCPSGTYWHSDKVQDSCTGERRCGNDGISTGKTYTIPATYQCTYISGANYGACTGNYSSAYKYVTSYNYSTVSGSSCSDGSFGPVACKIDGACSSRGQIFEANVTNWPVSDWCVAGNTPDFPNGTPSFPNQGDVTANWSCLGIGASHTDKIDCHAGRKLLAPSVDLKIDIGSGPSDGPISPNRDIVSDMDMSWTVVPNATGITTYCDKSGSSWGSGQLIPSKNLIDSDNNVALPSGALPINNTPYSLTCRNSNGNSEVDSTSVVDQVLTSLYCTPGPQVWTDCNKSCDTGTTYCSSEDNRCRPIACGSANCNTEACPVSSEWKEVRP